MDKINIQLFANNIIIPEECRFAFINIEKLTGNVVISAEAVNRYLITNTLINCTNDNDIFSVLEGNSYSANIVPNEGFELSDLNISVFMGGDDITASTYLDGVISIPVVTNNIIISNEITISPNSLISFTVNGVPYSAEHGMTWEEFLSSEYNIDGFVTDGTVVGNGDAHPITQNIDEVPTEVNISDVIQEVGYGIDTSYEILNTPIV